jgi:drug/metabolite transporter (DMT)-like permease
MKKAILYLHTAVLLAGFTPILGKAIDLNEGILVWFRLFLSALIAGVLFGSMGKLRKLPSKTIMKIAGVGLILAMHWVLFYGSVKYSNASVAVVCISAAGFFSALIEPFLLKKRINTIEVLLGLLAIAGVYIIFDFHPHFQKGVIFGILAALGSAIFPIFNKQLLEEVTVYELSFYEFLTGGLMLSMVLPFYMNLFPDGAMIPGKQDLILLVLLSLFCTVLAFILQLEALKKISAFTVNLSYNLEPVYGVLLAFYLYDEHEMVSHHFYLGIGLIILAILLQTLRTTRRNKVSRIES